MERDALLRHLELNDRHIAEMRVAIARHEAMLDKVRRRGGDTEAASELLRHLHDMLATHERLRDRILAAFRNTA